MKVGVTGASGFVGLHVTQALCDAGHDVRALVRRVPESDMAGVDDIRLIPTLGAETDRTALSAALDGLDVIVHLAARVHIMRGGDEAAFIDTNVGGSIALIEAAASAGVPRFIFMSSVKAVGERSGATPLNASSTPTPEDAYGRSKLAAERALLEIAHAQDIQLAILRPTFVYGWPAVGNLGAVIRALSKGIPLPLAGIDNRRDMIYVGNLADAVAAAINAKKLTDTCYFLCDGDAVSTPAFFRRIGAAFAKPARLFYLPVWILRALGLLSGKSGMIDRLTESLEVDSSPFRRDAGWQPAYNMDQGLAALAANYRTHIQDEG